MAASSSADTTKPTNSRLWTVQMTFIWVWLLSKYLTMTISDSHQARTVAFQAMAAIRKRVVRE